MLLNKCSRCGINSWEKTMCDGCENEIRRRDWENNVNNIRRLDPILEEYMNAHDNSICICGKPAAVRAKTPYAVYVCGSKDCGYNGVLSTVNGIVVVGNNT